MNYLQIKFLIFALLFHSQIFSSNQLELAIKNCDSRLFFNELLGNAEHLSDLQVRSLLALANNKKTELKKELNLTKKAGKFKADKLKIGLASSGIALSAWFAKNSLWSSDWKNRENSIFNIIIKKFYSKYNYRIYDGNLTFWTAAFALLSSGSVAYICSSNKIKLIEDNLIKINAIEYILKKSKTSIDRLELSNILKDKFVKEKSNINLYSACLLGALASGAALYSGITWGNIVFENVSISKKINKIKLQACIVAGLVSAATYCVSKNNLKSSDSDENLKFYKELAGKNV